MTTSRVVMFDEAIMSRIHFSLYYPPLDRDTTMKLWIDGLKRIETFDTDIVQFLKDQYDQGQRWSSREIRNTIVTAVALAQHEAERSDEKVILGKRHFKTIAKHLAAMHQEDKAVRATDNANGSDHFAPQGLGRSNVSLESTHKASREEDEGSDEDLEIQELELKLQMAKLKRRQKALKAKRANRSHRRDTSDDTSDEEF